MADSQFEAMLEKKNRGRRMPFVSNWKTRTFILSGQELEYRDGETSKATVNIANSISSKVEPSEADNKKYPFKLILSSGEIIFLNASNDQIRQSCLDTFNVAAINPNWEYVFAAAKRGNNLAQSKFVKSVFAMHTQEVQSISIFVCLHFFNNYLRHYYGAATIFMYRQ